MCKYSTTPTKRSFLNLMMGMSSTSWLRRSGAGLTIQQRGSRPILQYSDLSMFSLSLSSICFCSALQYVFTENLSLFSHRTSQCFQSASSICFHSAPLQCVFTQTLLMFSLSLFNVFTQTLFNIFLFRSYQCVFTQPLPMFSLSCSIIVKARL